MPIGAQPAREGPDDVRVGFGQVREGHPILGVLQLHRDVVEEQAERIHAEVGNRRQLGHERVHVIWVGVAHREAG